MRKSSLLRQLLINILLPVLVVLVTFSGVSYYFNRKKLQENNEELKQQIVSQSHQLISMYDLSLRLLEDDLNQRITEIGTRLNDDYFFSTDSIESADLYRISQEIGLDTSKEFIYIINNQQVIRNTTFAKDMGLDFMKVDTSFRSFFGNMRREKKLVIDRFGKEMATGRIKKYAFQPTRDGQYIIELGIYSEKADSLKAQVYKSVSEIRTNYPHITKVNMVIATENIHDDSIRTDHFPVVNKAILEKNNQRAELDSAGQHWYYDYCFISIKDAALYSGYIIAIVSNDSREKALLYAELRRFLLLFALTLLPLTLIVYFRSRQITRPITRLTEKAEIIAHGKLNERVPVEGNNEIAQLSGSFNKMIDELQGLYENLENKVVARTQELNHQKEIVEEKNKEILDSINYAQRIQYALLANEELLQEQLPEHFVLFMPKDIVSGDFYWATKVHATAEHPSRFYLAVCDSTGHGVPGAFMSLLNISFLNEAINEKLIAEPGQIFDHARTRLIENISQQGQKDGMDGVLLCKEGKHISLAVAHNGPVIIRNGTIIELDADKMPVGKGERNESFRTFTPELETGDMLYIFTDGYADQFGGPKGKKFKYANLYKLLSEIAQLPMAQQREHLRESFELWKGDLEQIDDVCIVGVRV
jgi:serine phosphatase RsbU (regulator of sigma subunit)